MNTNYRLITFLLVLSFSVTQLQAQQTWETFFKKPEKLIAKNKLSKLEKQLVKLREKKIPKKFNNDPSLNAFTYVMEARVNEAMSEFSKMEMSIGLALESLEKIKGAYKYAYVEGMLRLVDTYNEYGNYKKADSLLHRLMDSPDQYEGNELLAADVRIREVITAMNNGLYVEADENLKSLLEVWPALYEKSYSGEQVDPLDISYRKDMMARLYSVEIDLLVNRGLYKEAEAMIDSRKKEIRILTSNGGAGYFRYKDVEIRNELERGDLVKAGRLIRWNIDAKPTGRFLERTYGYDILVNAKTEKIEEAKASVIKLQKVQGKLGVANSFKKFMKDYYVALLNFYEGDLRVGVEQTRKLLAVEEKVVPQDHPMREEITRMGIDNSLNSGQYVYQKGAEIFFKNLKANLDRRYIAASFWHPFYQIALSGYYLLHTENPSESYAILDKKPYVPVLKQLEKTHRKYPEIIDNMKEYLVIRGHYQLGIDMYKEVVEGLKANSSTSGTFLGEKIVDLAKMQVYAGAYEAAELNVDEALKIIRRDEKQSREYTYALNSAAMLYGIIGRYDKAERLLNRSVSIAKKLEGDDKEIKLRSIEDLAFLYTRIGNYSETESLLTEVIAERTKTYGANSRRLIKPYSSLGEMYMIRGEYPDAEKSIRKALDITNKVYGDSTLLYAENLSLLVKLHLELGNYESGLLEAEKVLDIRRKKLVGNHVLLSATYTDMGLLYYNLKLGLDKVESYFIKARDIVEANFDNRHPLYAEAIKNIAYLYVERDRLDEALTLLNQADEIWSESLGNKNRSSGEVARLKGDIYTFKRDFEQARKEYEKSARYFRQIFSKEHPDYLNSQSKLARAFYINGDVGKVESILSQTTTTYLDYTKNYFPTLSEEEKEKFWAKIKPDFEFYNTVAVDFSVETPKYLSDMYDYALATKGLLLNSSIKTRNSILHSGDSILIHLFETWLSKKEYLTSTLAQSDEDLIANSVDVEALKQEIDLLEKELSEKSVLFAESFENKSYTWNDVRKVLKPDEAAVEIIRFREFDEKFNEDSIRYAALIVTSDTKKNPTLVLLKNGKEMEGRSFMLQRNSVKYKIKENLSYETYWKDVHRALENKKVVYLSPDGVYNQINMESLMIGDGKFVIDEMNVRVLSSTKMLAMVRSKATKKKADSEQQLTAMLFGNPDYYEDPSTQIKAQESSRRGTGTKYIAQLPGTEKEVNMISDLLNEKGWKTETYLGEQATEEKIKDINAKTLIHIATHGFFDDKKTTEQDGFQIFEEDNPLDRAGLLTKGAGDVLLSTDMNYNIDDGVLTAYEAMNLSFDQTELVVLSACETGRGEIHEGEGVFGLQRSFLVAGADAMIMSLFQVSDEVTQMLMVEFYKNWLNGQDKRTAFNNAQITIKKSYPDPIYWGAFMMVGKQ